MTRPAHAVIAAWERTLRRRANDRALVEAATGREVSFGELEAGAAALALDAGALAGRAVVFALPNGARWVELFLALLRAGAVAVPLDPGEPPAAQRAIAAALRAAFLWEDGALQALPDGRRFRDPATCLIKLTSGTTGAPRPLVFTAEQVLADGRQVTRAMGIRETDTNYALIPFGHSYGLGNVTFPLLAQGVPVVCGTAPLPHAIADEVARWRPTVFPAVPAMLRALVAADLEPVALASLRLVISAGAPLPPETAAGFAARFGRRVHAFYGSSETGGIAYDRSGAATLRGGVGTALPGVRLMPLRGQRLRIASAAVFTCGNPRREGPHGAWVPADRVSIDARGGLTLLGRRGTTVKIAGRRVNLGEVAARLRRVTGVRDVWVGVSSGHEPVLGAAIVGARPVAEIRAELLAGTAPWKVPKKWAVLHEFPLTARGKVDARALQAAVFR